MATDLRELILGTVCILGFFSLCRAILSLIRWVWVVLLRPPKNLKEYGSWAIVTGCTDGIGKALAFELASKGLNLVLVGRNPEKLKVTSTEIRQRYNEVIDIKTVAMDLAKLSGKQVSMIIKESIKGLDIGILINNAGMSYPSARFFHEVDQELMESILKVNMNGATWITWSVLPIMLKKNKGAIVNIGSGASIVIPTSPLLTLYAATKAYIYQLSRSLHVEYKRFGIDVQCQIPSYVATKLLWEVASIERPTLFTPSPQDFARASIRSIGYEQKCAPYWAHSLQWAFANFIPDTVLDSWRLSTGIRRRSRSLNAST